MSPTSSMFPRSPSTPGESFVPFVPFGPFSIIRLIGFQLDKQFTYLRASYNTILQIRCNIVYIFYFVGLNLQFYLLIIIKVLSNNYQIFIFYLISSCLKCLSVVNSTACHHCCVYPLSSDVITSVYQ